SLPVIAIPMAKHYFLNTDINNKILPSVVLIPTQTSITKFTPSNSDISGNTGSEIQELHQ
ncbi:33818_t:CDS:1, partial [Gigaspora margarita]